MGIDKLVNLSKIMYKECLYTNKKKINSTKMMLIGDSQEKEIQVFNKCKKRSFTNEEKFIFDLGDPTLCILCRNNDDIVF